jgi:hypothetical protein
MILLRLRTLMLEVIGVGGCGVVDVKGLFGDEAGNVFVALVGLLIRGSASIS